MHEVSSAEYADWVALFTLEPWGGHIDDLRAGSLMSLIYNLNRSSEVSEACAADFTPWSGWHRSEPRARSAEEIAANAFGINLPELKSRGEQQIVLRRGG
ncbi:phage tail assembly protein T [Paraburkholderia caribensis]|uniref:phage tail assembly protein T n=1 Tax=Paraburkholderia caribensis TaxID=75105 RepID=UPI001CC3659F|nr:hypothetical protein [Paraburkholderia caribensis]